MQNAYVLISPCKDEAEYLERNLKSIESQTVKPAQWVIVDDGSSDDGMAIVARYQDRMPFIKVIRRDSGARAVGGGVVRAFEEGLAAVDVDYDFLCKFDVDLDMPPRYFEIMLQRMAEDPLLGTCSGKCYYIDEKTGGQIPDVHGDEQSVGPAKFYRRTCFEEMGGFRKDVGWDAFDCHLVRWLGWRAQSWLEPETRFEHMRPMGTSQTSIYHGRIRHGRGSYLLGTHPLFFCLVAARRLVTQKPYVTGTAAYAYGYFQAMVQRAHRHGDAEVTRFVQRFQLRALRIGKRASAEKSFRERRAELGLPQPGPGHEV